MTRYLFTLELENLDVLTVADLGVLRLFDLGSGPTLYTAARSAAWRLSSQTTTELMAVRADVLGLAIDSRASSLVTHAYSELENS